VAVTICAAFAIVTASSIAATADTNPSVLYQLPTGTDCLKGFGNCVIYVKSAQLPNGRIVAGFEQATVVDYPAPDTIGGAKGETLPVYKSDDNGTTWQKLSDVPPPSAYGNSAMAKYNSNWTNPFFFVMPQTVGNIAAGTLLLATVVSGEDEWYREHKAANSSWVPDNDGDRRDVAIALYSSTNNGASWTFLNIIATGGWQGGSAGAPGRFSNANTTHQQDPLWEPYLMVYNNQIVAYYSDENDYVGYNTSTGVPTLAADNATGPDDGGQILVHKTWNGTSATWSQPVVDVAGDTWTFNGSSRIGGGRPGMTTVVPTTDNKWLITYEYWGGGANTRYKIASNPLQFAGVGGAAGAGVNGLPVTSGSAALAGGGSPVTIRLPDGRLVYNAAGSGNVWINNGSSTGAWTQRTTTMPGGYSRQLQYVNGLNQVLILGNAGPSTIKYALWDQNATPAPFERINNRNSGLALDVFEASTADGGNVVQWAWNGGANQKWQVQDAGGGYVRIVNSNSGKCLDVYQWSTANGGNVVQWTCGTGNNQQWQVQDAGGGFVRFVNRHSGKCLDVNAYSMENGGNVQQWTCGSGTNQQWSRVTL
jgi:hypothetical protein